MLYIYTTVSHYCAFSNNLSSYKEFYIHCDKLPRPRGSQHRALRLTWGLRLFFILGNLKEKKMQKKESKEEKHKRRKNEKKKLDSKFMNYSLYKFPAQFTYYK